MAKFAKLFEIEDNQVLVLRGWNDDEEHHEVTTIARDEFVGEMQTVRGYSSENGMNEAFDAFTETDARQFLLEIEKAVGDLYGKNPR